MLRVIIVEDKRKMAELLARALTEQSCSVRLAHTGHDGFQLAMDSPFDVIVLDVMLPGIDGFEVARELRRAKVSIPILFLTARDSKADIVCGLELGGDDYLTKPFSFVELVARIRALARRRIDRFARGTVASLATSRAALPPRGWGTRAAGTEGASFCRSLRLRLASADRGGATP